MTISVVIPALEEAAQIVAAVESARGESVRLARVESARGHERDRTDAPEGSKEPQGSPVRVEVIVIDGGSRDATVRLAREAGARVFVAPPGGRGRAHQLRLGSERSTGEVILFLHADTRLAAGWEEAVERAMSDPGCAGGAFSFRFAERGARERWIERWVAVRVALLALPYGDQALFVRREVLEAMGGVPEVPIMEDLDLVRAIKRAGRLRLLDLPATTSSRRYRERGTLRTLFWHQVALLGWWLGWDRARLGRRMGR